MIDTSRSEDRRDRGGPRGQSVKSLAVRKSVSIKETVNLETCEKDIQSSFERVAAAFAAIKAHHLYKEAGFSSFDSYCADRWGITRTHGYRLAAANEVMKSLPKKCRQLVTVEGVAREIGKVPEEKRVEVLKSVAAAGPVTAKAIRDAKPKVIEVEPEQVIRHCSTCTCGVKQ